MIEDLTKELDKEEGTAFTDRDLLFRDFDGGDVFNYTGEYTDHGEMFERDGKARTLEQVLTLPIRSAPHALERGKAPAEVHQEVERMLYSTSSEGGMSTPIDTIIAQMTGAFTTRKAFFEKVWTVRDDRFVYDKIAWRPASTCAIVRDPKDGAFRGFRQRPAHSLTTVSGRPSDLKDKHIKTIRALVYIHGQHRDPMEGISDMDIALWCYQTKQKIRFLWYSFLEGQALPKTLVKHKDQAQANQAARKVAGLRQGGIAALTSDVEVDPFESSGKGAAEFQAALKWLDAEASGSVMAGFTDLTGAAASGVGSYALSKDSSDFFLMGRTAVSKEMAGTTINPYLVAPLVHANWGSKTPVPNFTFAPIAKDTAQAAMEALTGLVAVQTSRIPEEFYEQLVEKTAGYLEMDVDKVRKGINEARKKAEEQAAAEARAPQQVRAAGVAGAVDAATQAVEEKKRLEVAAA